MIRRAGIVSKGLSVICAALLVGVPVQRTSAQTDFTGRLPANSWQSSKLSQALLNDANLSVERLIVANQSGQLTASEVEDAATSLQILWDHFQEIGLNAALEKELLSNQDLFMDTHLNDAQVESYRSQLALQGVHVTADQIRSVIDLGPQERQNFLSMVQRVGLYRTEMALVVQLREKAQELRAGTVAGPVASHGSRHAAHLVRVITPVCGSCFILSAIGLATLCGVTAPACGAALGTCLTCALGG